MIASHLSMHSSMSGFTLSFMLLICGCQVQKSMGEVPIRGPSHFCAPESCQDVHIQSQAVG